MKIRLKLWKLIRSKQQQSFVAPIFHVTQHLKNVCNWHSNFIFFSISQEIIIRTKKYIKIFQLKMKIQCIKIGKAISVMRWKEIKISLSFHAKNLSRVDLFCLENLISILMAIWWSKDKIRNWFCYNFLVQDDKVMKMV